VQSGTLLFSKIQNTLYGTAAAGVLISVLMILLRVAAVVAALFSFHTLSRRPFECRMADSDFFQ
jgi:hypothetical protein